MKLAHVEVFWPEGVRRGSTQLTYALTNEKSLDSFIGKQQGLVKEQKKKEPEPTTGGNNNSGNNNSGNNNSGNNNSGNNNSGNNNSGNNNSEIITQRWSIDEDLDGKRGFTLLEVIITISILAVMMISTSVLLRSSSI